MSLKWIFTKVSLILISGIVSKELFKMFALMAMYVVIGLLLAGLALPLIQKRIPPNMWYGFRVRKTLSSPDIWYPANAYMAKYMLVWGLTIAITSFLFYFIPG